MLLCLIVSTYFVACKDSSGKFSNHSEPLSDTLSIAKQDTQIEEVYDSEVSYELNYVVMVADGYNYDTLRKIAIQTSKLLGLKFDTLDRYYNKSRRKIVLPDNHEDDLWVGDYIFRRVGGDFVSIEMREAYIDTLTEKSKIKSESFYADTLKMFVFANMYPEKKHADSLLKILKPKFKQATIIPTEIYMGCMH